MATPGSVAPGSAQPPVSAYPPASTAATSTSTCNYKALIPKVLLWQNPAHSGIVLAESLAAIVVLRYGAIFRFLLKIVLFVLAGTTAVEFVSSKFSRTGLVSSYRPSRYISVSKVQIEKFSQKTAAIIEYGLSELKALVDCQDVGLSAITFVGLFFVYFFSGFLTFTSLLFLLTIAAFTVPFLSVKFEKEINEGVAIAHGHAKKQLDNAHAQAYKVAGPHIDTASKHFSGLATKLGYQRDFPATEKSTPLAASDVPTTKATLPSGPVLKSTKVSEHGKSAPLATGSATTASTKNAPFVPESSLNSTSTTSTKNAPFVPESSLNSTAPTTTKTAPFVTESSLKTEPSVLKTTDLSSLKTQPASTSLKTESLVSDADVAKAKAAASTNLKTEQAPTLDEQVAAAIAEAKKAETVPTIIGNVENKF